MAGVLVHTIQCPRCGGRTKIQRGEEHAKCMHCGTVVALSEALKRERAMARQFPPMSPLKLGMKCTYRAKQWELVGRQVLREQDDEEVCVWEEYLLVSADGDLLYLEYDEGKWKITEPFVPDRALSPAELAVYTAGASVHMDGRQRRVTDNGVYQIAFAEGDFPWMVTPGKALRYLDLTFGNDVHCVEWTDEEIEFYRGQFVDERQIFIMFELRDLLSAREQRLKLLKSRQVFGATAMAMGILAFVVFMQSFSSGARTEKGSGRADAIQIGQEGQRFGPIALSAVGRVHRLEVQGQMRETSCWLQAVIEDENQQEIIGADRDMWDESGSDSDGYWHESDLSASTNFVLAKAGNYYVRIYAEREGATNPGSGVTASFTLYERAMYGLWPGIIGGLLTVFGIGFLLAGSPSGANGVWKTVKRTAASGGNDD